MITKKELEQIKWAIGCMFAYNINGDDFISKNNVLGLLERFGETDDKKSDE